MTDASPAPYHLLGSACYSPFPERQRSYLLVIVDALEAGTLSFEP